MNDTNAKSVSDTNTNKLDKSKVIDDASRTSFDTNANKFDKSKYSAKLDKSKYSAILNRPHWEPTSKTSACKIKHERMSMDDRSAIFAPFAALSGYDETIEETARTTDKKIVLSESQKEELNQKLYYLIDRMEENTDNSGYPEGIIRAEENPPKVTITYFKADDKKDGGEYVKMTGEVVKVDLYQRIIVMGDGKNIYLNDVTEIEVAVGGFANS